ncbi:MAG: cobalamin biosynthesis protein CobD [Actinobacteria bacterium]|nr:MAG: cobalamin biosynthesis protein CobD [Actinomycetota bacterium]
MIGALGVLADVALGEPPAAVHPVRGFGRLMAAVELRTYRDSRLAGAGYTTLGLAAGLASGLFIRGPVATYLAVAGRSLWDEARGVQRALDDDELETARRRLPALVGRDPTGLDEKEVARAAVESVAENTVDAIVAPILWGRAGLALAYRAVNTMDALVGHTSPRYERFGWASARLDDGANWLPARLTAAAVAAARPARARAVWEAVRRQAPAHPSPNAGVAEAAFAAALDLRLGGENRYGNRVELRPPLGTGRPPEPRDIERAVRLSQQVTAAVAVLA